MDRLANLPALPGGKKRNFDRSQCTKLCSVARANIGEYEQKLKDVAEKEAVRQREQESKLEQAERLKREKQKQLEQEEEERKLKQKQLEEEALLLAEKRREIAQKWSQKQEEKAQQAAQKKTRKKRAEPTEGEEASEIEDEAYSNSDTYGSIYFHLTS